MAEIQPFQNYFAFIKVRDDKEKLAEKVAAFEKDVENFETFLEIHQGDSEGPFLCGSDMCFGEASHGPLCCEVWIPNLKHFCGVDVKEIAKAPAGRINSSPQFWSGPPSPPSLSVEKIVAGNDAHDEDVRVEVMRDKTAARDDAP